MNIARTWLLLGAGALLVTSAEAAAQDRMQGSGIRISKDGSTATTSTLTTTTSGGDVTLATTPFTLSAYANLMTEGNIMAHLATGDSLEIELASLGQTKATDQRVRDYATMLATDHRAHLPEVLEMYDEDITPVPMASDPEGMRLRETLNALRSMPAGSAWDAAFVRFNVQHHQNELDILNANVKNAHDDDLEELIDATLTSLTKHRDMGRTLATNLAITLP